MCDAFVVARKRRRCRDQHRAPPAVAPWAIRHPEWRCGMKDRVGPPRPAALASAPRTSAAALPWCTFPPGSIIDVNDRQPVATDLGEVSAYSSTSDHTFSEPRKP